jgi:hypothetical protein
MQKVPTSSGRRFKSEKIDINNSSQFDQPDRDPGRRPSLPLRSEVQQRKKSNTFINVPPKDLPLKVEQELAIASTRSIPIPPSPPSLVPSKKGEQERVPSLSELIGV